MDLLLRNIDSVAVKKIDELAKSKKMSRNEFLKRFIEELAMNDLFQEQYYEFQQTLNKNNEVLSEIVQLLPDIKKQLIRLRIQ